MKDTIGLLVKIFGSRELFVDEYKKFLTERLLSRQSDFYRIGKEAEYLELMKLRFGEESMADCNVMIADIVNSERDKKNILPHRARIAVFYQLLYFFFYFLDNYRKLFYNPYGAIKHFYSL